MKREIRDLVLTERDRRVLSLLEHVERLRKMTAEEYLHTPFRFERTHPLWKHLERVAKSKWPSQSFFSSIALRYLGERNHDEVYEIYASFVDSGEVFIGEAEHLITGEEIAAAWQVPTSKEG